MPEKNDSHSAVWTEDKMSLEIDWPKLFMFNTDSCIIRTPKFWKKHKKVKVLSLTGKQPDRNVISDEIKRNCVSSTVWLYNLDLNEMSGEKPRWKSVKDVACCRKYILEAAPRHAEH